MKVVLTRYWDIANVNTRLPESLNKIQGALPPLGIAFVAAALERAGHDVSIVDAIAEGLSPEAFRQKLQQARPDVVGVTAMTSSIQGTLEAARTAKRCGAIVIAGGGHMALYPAETMSYDFIDYGVLGEGDESTVELLAALAAGRNADGIEGIASRGPDGTVRAGEPRIVENLDALPSPAYHLLEMDRYSSIIGMHPVSTAVATRGCPYRCGFCSKGPSDRKFRTRDPIRVVDEMAMLAERYQVAEVMFYDDVFTLRRELVVAVCEEILRRGLTVRWEAPTRVNHVDPELLALMRRAGCRMLRFGVESGDPDVLEFMGKATDLAAVGRAFRWTRRAGIRTFAYFILGYATETPQTMERTIEFARKLNPDYVMFTVATPYPDTPLYEWAVERGIVPAGDRRDLTLGRTCQRIPYLVPDAEQWVRKAYRRFYLRPSRILKQLGQLRTWRDLKKNWQGFKALVFFRMMKTEQ